MVRYIILGTFSTTSSWITTKLIFIRVSRGVCVCDASQYIQDDDRVSHTCNNNNTYIMRLAVRRCSICIYSTFYSLHRCIIISLDNVIVVARFARAGDSRRRFENINIIYIISVEWYARVNVSTVVPGIGDRVAWLGV